MGRLSFSPGQPKVPALRLGTGKCDQTGLRTPSTAASTGRRVVDPAAALSTTRTPRRPCTRIEEFIPQTGGDTPAANLCFSPRRRLRRPAASPSLTPSPREFDPHYSSPPHPHKEAEAVSSIVPDRASTATLSYTTSVDSLGALPPALPPLRPSHRRSSPAQRTVVLSPQASPSQQQFVPSPPKDTHSDQLLSWASSNAGLVSDVGFKHRLRSDPVNPSNDRLGPTAHRPASAQFDEISFDLDDDAFLSRLTEELAAHPKKLEGVVSRLTVKVKPKIWALSTTARLEQPPIGKCKSGHCVSALMVKIEIQEEQPAWAMISPTLRLTCTGRVAQTGPPRPHVRSVSAASQNTLARFSEVSPDLNAAVNDWVSELRSPFDPSARRIFGSAPKAIQGIAPPALRPRRTSSHTDVRKPPIRLPLRGASAHHRSPTVWTTAPPTWPSSHTQTESTYPPTEVKSVSSPGELESIPTPSTVDTTAGQPPGAASDPQVTVQTFPADPSVLAPPQSSPEATEGTLKKPPPPVNSKKAPPAKSKKAPPPPKSKKAPPATKAKAGAGIKDDVPPDPFIPAPPTSLTPRKLNWNPIPPAKISGTIWDGLLEEEATWPRAITAMEEQEMLAERSKLQVRGTQRRPSFLDGRSLVDSGDRASHFRRNSVSVGDNAVLIFPWDRGKHIDFVAARFEPDFAEATMLFFEDESAPKLKASDPTSPKVKPKGVLDGRRLHNLEISMKGLGVFTDAQLMTRTFVDMNLGVPETAEFNSDTNARKLDPDALQVILGLLPTVEESRLISTAPKEELSRAEAIILEWSSIPRLRAKVEACRTLVNYKSEEAKIHARLERQEQVLSGLDRVLSRPPALKCLLGLCLRLGNYINYYTNKRAQGFQLNSVEALRKATATDNTFNFLKFVAATIDSQYPPFWGALTTNMEGIQEVQALNPDETVQQLLGLEDQIRKIRIEITDHTESHNQRFILVMTRLVTEAASQLSRFRQRNDHIKDSLITKARLFAPNASTVADGLDVLKFLGIFYKDLIRARTEYRDGIMKKKLQELRRGQQRARLAAVASSDNLLAPKVAPKTSVQTRASVQ